MIDYFLHSAASNIKLEILDAHRNLVRRFSSEDQPEKRSPLPIAERWFPKPSVLEKNPGMHRFLWDLTWGSSGGPIPEEESEYRNPSGPKVVPGTYELCLTVDGRMQSQPLRVIMDPRSPATPEILREQLELGQQIFAETIEAGRALAEIGSVVKQLTEVEQTLGGKNPALRSVLADAQSEISRILNQKARSGEQEGLQDAFADMASALHVVETGDRATPAQAIVVYKESSQRVKARIAEWTSFKHSKLPQLNQKLSNGNLAPIALSELERLNHSH